MKEFFKGLGISSLSYVRCMRFSMQACPVSGLRGFLIQYSVLGYELKGVDLLELHV